ncbi:MAG TPA: TIGR03118 family protein, partial [Fimbriimonadales bacterium]|nr:TIGR03118 family protein [Fimbriimonadales bacterium]
MASLFLTCLSAANADFEQTNLVSDGFIAAEHFDPNLVNAWGLSLSPTGPFWVANNGTGTSTLYDGEGNAFPPGNPLIVDVLPTDDSSPTGTVFNSTEGFRIASMGIEGPSRFLFVSEEGRITGWNPDVDPMHALVAVDNSSRMAVYKGLALARNGRGTYIYATNFRDGVVEVYDSRFRWVTNFTDPNMESGY